MRPIATRETFPPGSTMKVVTSTAAYNLKPALAGFDYPVQACQTFSDSNVKLCDQSGPCGGTMIPDAARSRATRATPSSACNSESRS